MAEYKLCEIAPDAWGKVKERDILYFGAYPKETGGEPLPIGWEVLRKEDGKFLLLSTMGLDVMQYDSRDVRLAELMGEEVEPITWENCELRAWLKGEFWRVAFCDEERCLIAPTVTDGEAVDRVSLLSWKDANAYVTMPYRGLRKSAPLTDLADGKIRSEHSMEIRMCWRWDRGWWLRTMSNKEMADCVVYDWALESIKDNYCSDHQAVRPALWLDPKGGHSTDAD